MRHHFFPDRSQKSGAPCISGRKAISRHPLAKGQEKGIYFDCRWKGNPESRDHQEGAQGIFKTPFVEIG